MGMPQRKERSSSGRGATGKQTWRQWITEFGAHVRRVREFLGLSQEQVARAAGVSQGAVSRFEGGRGLSTPFVGIMKINLALAHALKELEPDLLTDEVRRFMKHLEVLKLPDDAATPVGPVGPNFKKIQLSPNPELLQVIELYYELPESKRQAFIAVMTATISALRNA
jgi:transcriptional regulator with XRE-family HTH domain